MKYDKNVVIHRGVFKKGMIENSLSSFKECASLGFMIELDTHIIKDGNVIVFHDDNFSRMCGVNKLVKDSTLSEVKSYKLDGSNQSIPTLLEVLDVVKGKVPILIELKCDVRDNSLEDKVIEIMREYKGDFVFESFSPFILRRLCYLRKKYDLKFDVGLLTKSFWMFVFALVFSKISFVAFNYKLLKKRRFRFISKHYPTLVYTVKKRGVYNSDRSLNIGYIVENYEDILD